MMYLNPLKHRHELIARNYIFYLFILKRGLLNLVMNLEKIFIIVGVLIYVIFATSVFLIYLYLAMYFFKMHCAIYFSF